MYFKYVNFFFTGDILVYYIIAYYKYFTEQLSMLYF